MLNRKKNTGKKMAISALIGGIAGYLGGILTAPQSGKETREDIADKADDIKDSSEDQLVKLQEDLKDLIRDTKVKTVALSAQAREEFNESVVKAKDAQNKATTVLKAFKAGEADDPELNKAIKQAKQAQKNLSKYLKG
jgi:gas vesicle protein